jgi:hypothetical protein
MEFNSDMPDNYLYCNDCDGYTPHDITSKHIIECMVCGNYRHEHKCCSCGFEFPDELFKEPYYVQIHNSGCHYNYYYKQIDLYSTIEFNINNYCNEVLYEFIKNNKNVLYDYNKIKHHLNIECGCPKMIVYPHSFVSNYDVRSEYSLDCYDARSWDYDLRCPICGELTHVSDSNC